MKQITFLLLATLISLNAIAQCTYQLELNDSFGDGWNGNSIDVLVNGTIVLDDATLTEGTQEVLDITMLNDGDEVSITVDDTGDYGLEVSYRILDNAFQVVATGDLVDIPEPITVACATCIPPETLVVDAIDATTATLNWTENSEALAGYEYVVVLSGEDPEDMNTIPIVSGMTDFGELSTAIEGLAENTNYDAYVRSKCSSEDNSPYSPVASFTTACELFVPDYLQSFSEGVAAPPCWKQASNGLPENGPTDFGGSSWFADDYLNDTQASDNMDNAVKMNFFFNDKQDWLITPVFDLSGGSYELAFNVAVTAFGNGEPSEMGSDDEVRVLISNDDGVTWTPLLSYTTANTPSNFGQQEIIDLSAYTGEAIIAFWGTEGMVNDPEDYDFFIDEVTVRSPLNCTPPTYTISTVEQCDDNAFSVTIVITDLGSAAQLTLSDDKGNASQTVDTIDEVLSFGPYETGTDVLFTITGDDEDCTLTVTQSFDCPAINDLCAEAIPINDGQTLSGATVAATFDDVGNCGTPNTAPGVWYVYNDGGNAKEINVFTCDQANFDTKISVFTGSCESLVCLDGNDDGADCDNNTSALSFATDGTSDYYILVHGFNTATGDFELTVDEVLGVEETPFSSFSFFPNPVENQLTLSAQQPIEQVVIYSVSGQIVYKDILQATAKNIDMAELSMGLYLMKITVAGSTNTFQLLKK